MRSILPAEMALTTHRLGLERPPPLLVNEGVEHTATVGGKGASVQGAEPADRDRDKDTSKGYYQSTKRSFLLCWKR